MRMKARLLISKMASLAEQIKKLSCPEPTNFDPEEDDFDITRATVVNKDSGEDIEDSSFASSKLRKKNVSLLSDEDQKYQGRRVSRSEMAKMRGDFMDSDESEDEVDKQDNTDGALDDVQNNFNNTKEDEEDLDEERDDDDENYDDDDNNDKDGDEDNYEDVDDDDENSDDDDEDNNNRDDDDEEDDDGEEDDDDEGGDILSSRLGDDGDQGAGISSFSASKMEEEVAKGKAVKYQLSLWDTFLEYRIRLQKAFVLVNKLPQYDVSESFTASSNGKQETIQGKKALSDLLYKLLIIQEKLLDQNPETRKTLYPSASNGVKKDNKNDDDEIPSDSENEEKDDDDDDDNGDKMETEENSLKLQPLKRKAGFTQDEFCECITKRHASFQGVRDSIISKWSEKTRLASGKLSSKSFSAFDRSALSQIKQVMNDKQRLIKRSQLKRSSYKVLGKTEKSDDVEAEGEANAHLKDYDTEIFDDDDFYHQLLREFIERQTSSNSDDPIEMGRKWLELQKLRRKIKKKVDTKASKGRKLRYNILSKLVSYMPPIDRGSMPDSSRNELFSSLFGQSKAQSET